MLSSVGRATADGNERSTNPYFVNMNGTLFYRAASNSSSAFDLWKTNGTPVGTNLFKHFDERASMFPLSSTPAVPCILWPIN